MHKKAHEVKAKLLFFLLRTTRFSVNLTRPLVLIQVTRQFDNDTTDERLPHATTDFCLTSQCVTHIRNTEGKGGWYQSSTKSSIFFPDRVLTQNQT